MRQDIRRNVYFVRDDYWPHDTTLWVKDFHGNNPQFTYYFFRWIAPQLASLDVGSANPTLNRNHVHPIEVMWPPKAEQRGIAHILGTLDDKIELNRRMNETLEAMARALFKSWFVDFLPVRAKMKRKDARTQGRKEEQDNSLASSRPGGLAFPPEILDLFPDKLVESQLGEIPEGWQVGKLGNISALNPESWSKKSRPDFIQYVDLSNTKWGRIESVANYEQSEAPSRAQRVLRHGDTIVGTVRPGNGSYALISESRLTGSTGFAVLRPNQPCYREIVYLAATAGENIDALAHLADGGAYPAVRPEVVAETDIVLADDRVYLAFSRACLPLLDKIAMNELESRTLAQLRDTLLPKLISGELRVTDAEKIIERQDAKTQGRKGDFT